MLVKYWSNRPRSVVYAGIRAWRASRQYQRPGLPQCSPPGANLSQRVKELSPGLGAGQLETGRHGSPRVAARVVQTRTGSGRVDDLLRPGSGRRFPRFSPRPGTTAQDRPRRSCSQILDIGRRGALPGARPAAPQGACPPPPAPAWAGIRIQGHGGNGVGCLFLRRGLAGAPSWSILHRLIAFCSLCPARPLP